MGKVIIFVLLSLSSAFVYGDQFADSCLERHNYYRRLEGKPLMHLDPKAMAQAKRRAAELSSKCAFDHMGNMGSGFGENINSVDDNCKDVVDKWYKEKPNYNPRNPVLTMDAGHYTQLVWKATTQLGCAIASHCRYKHVVVCNYYPPGNYRGKFPENV
ncbi:hypothetical protein B4U80_01425 [Leptotrombidium deliense]|uniref:SCP domain-containing protein n=1 Tax=Leptotrombidium deliense TaxID=299467 RepID=A0A443S8Q1_9ACAR|nr:hypothetical protein B4U80_01425 [Leptotrombidium deliense]